MGTTARIMLIAPCAGKASTSTTRTRKITSSVALSKQVKSLRTVAGGGSISTANHLTAFFARAWSPGIHVAVTSAAKREIEAIVPGVQTKFGPFAADAITTPVIAAAVMITVASNNMPPALHESFWYGLAKSTKLPTIHIQNLIVRYSVPAEHTNSQNTWTKLNPDEPTTGFT
ncbi:hypothetical protein BD769DRAFT_1637406 [Suillus cothurnatus]|nr:hypothetical protein BD769DRAFT_1637406 [Suillus cothurnatus]